MGFWPDSGVSNLLDFLEAVLWCFRNGESTSNGKFYPQLKRTAFSVLFSWAVWILFVQWFECVWWNLRLKKYIMFQKKILIFVIIFFKYHMSAYIEVDVPTICWSVLNHWNCKLFWSVWHKHSSVFPID